MTFRSSQAVWKYEFEAIDAPQPRKIPVGASIVQVSAQHDKICFWALVNLNNRTETRKFKVHGTGYPIASTEKYLGTAHINPFVWHLFEEKA